MLALQKSPKRDTFEEERSTTSSRTEISTSDLRIKIQPVESDCEDESETVDSGQYILQYCRRTHSYGHFDSEVDVDLLEAEYEHLYPAIHGYNAEEVSEELPCSSQKYAELQAWVKTGTRYGSVPPSKKANSMTSNGETTTSEGITITVDEEVPFNFVSCAISHPIVMPKLSIPEHKSSFDHENSILQEEVKLKTETVPLIKNASTRQCRVCKVRYTRQRATRLLPILFVLFMICVSILFFFPWGFFTLPLLVTIPFHIRRPVCKKCKESWYSI